MAGSWCAHDTILANKQLLDTVRSTNLSDQLHHLWIPVSPIATNDEEASVDAFWDREEDAGYEGLAVVLFLEDLDLLAKTRTEALHVSAQCQRKGKAEIVLGYEEKFHGLIDC